MSASTSAPVQEILSCYDRGWYVTPLCWPNAGGQCGCPKHHINPQEIGKAPLLGKGYQDHLLSEEEVRQLWTHYPRANYGILLKPSSLFVLDADSLEADREIETRGVPPGPRVRRGDHVHRYFRNSEGIIGRAIHQGASGKIDILSDGYVVGPGSLHRCGTRYIEEIAFAAIELDDPPRWSIDLVRNKECDRDGKAEAIPQDLAEVDIDSLPLSRFIKALIRCGPAADPHKYPSRSEAVFAVLIALLNAKITDNRTLASILLNPESRISDKPREQGRRWLAAEIARAKVKWSADSNGGAAPFEMQRNFQAGNEADEEENARYAEQERPVEDEEERKPTPYPCPDVLWQGAFAEVADRVGMRCWEVWAGTYAALSAVAHRNLHWRYFGDLFGMAFVLLLSPTGAGKSVCTDTCVSSNSRLSLKR